MDIYSFLLQGWNVKPGNYRYMIMGQVANRVFVKWNGHGKTGFREQQLKEVKCCHINL